MQKIDQNHKSKHTLGGNTILKKKKKAEEILQDIINKVTSKYIKY